MKLIDPNTTVFQNVSRGILVSLFIVSLTTGLCFFVRTFLELSNLVMLYLLVVAFVSSRFGRVKSIVASVLRACKRIKVAILHPIFGASLNVLPAKKPRYSSL